MKGNEKNKSKQQNVGYPWHSDIQEISGLKRRKNGTHHYTTHHNEEYGNDSPVWLKNSELIAQLESQI